MSAEAKRGNVASHAAAVRAALGAGPEPDASTRRAERLLESAPTPALEAAAPDAVTRVVYAACAVAPFLAPWLGRHPEAWEPLLSPELERPLERGALEREADTALEIEDEDAAERALRELKYRALARITVRDASEALVPLARSSETLAELSRLGDVLLSAALRLSRRRVEARLGAPVWKDEAGVAREHGFVVLGLGKLGSEELNYSSDVDLIYVHESVADPLGGPQERDPAAWFTALAQELGRILSRKTPDGFLYRVDLDLRPRGASGPIVVSEEALASYYETAAATWERVAFMKARPVAGDHALGWRVVRGIHPLLYQASMDFSAVERIRALKEEIGAARRDTDAGFDVKTDPGGIRDVEFVAQAMQLLHGGRILQLRGRSTQRTLASLASVDLMPEAACEALLDAYRFLRRVENRLQMEQERQVHRVPQGDEARERLALATGFRGEDALAAFDGRLAGVRAHVGAIAGDLAGEDRHEAVLDLIARHQLRLLALPEMRAMMERLAEQLARAIDAAVDPDLAMNNLDRFVEGIGGRRFYYELLLDRPELVPRLAAVFGSSSFLSQILAQHPRLIEPIFEQPERLLLTPEELRSDLAELREALAEGAEPDFERDLAALRLFRHRQVVNVGLLDLDGKIERAEAERALTEIAEAILEAALEIARRELASSRKAPESVAGAQFLIVGMGKLASRELSYGSDLDLIFLYDVGDDPLAISEAQEHFARLVQRLISVLVTPTPEGVCYEIDPRLRPSGRQGTLVTSLASFRRYHESEAAVWERQILLRARPLCGDVPLGDAYEALRREILARPLLPDAADEIRRIRARMESELAAETEMLRNLKAGRGGLLDVENAVQYLQLRHGAAHPALLDVARVERTIGKLTECGLLEERDAATLLEGWDFLQRLSSRLRIVEDRSISELDEERGDLDALALRLGYPPGEREAGPRRALLRDYELHTEGIRAVYERVLGPSVD